MDYKGSLEAPKTKLEALERALADAKSENYKSNYVKHHGEEKYNQLIAELVSGVELERCGKTSATLRSNSC